MKSILLLLLSVLSLTAGNVTLTWDQNTETNIDHYVLYRSVNGGGFLGTQLNFPTNIYTFTDVAPGNSYSFYVTAVSTTMLESAPSSTVAFTPPSISPPIDILSVKPSGYVGGSWTTVLVSFTPVNLATYQATGVTITAVSGSSTQTWNATSSPFSIPILAVKTYTFSASLSNSSGTSGPGAVKVLDGTTPASVRNVRIAVGP